jgi:hypothetical protein
VGCSCGHVFTEGAPVAPPPVEAAYPRPIYPPGFAPQTDAAPSIAERIIPTKNPKALMAYYSGCFSFTICPAPLLGPLGIILGILGLQECKRHPGLPGKGHAITGIVLGTITTLIVIVVTALIIWASFNQPKTG